VPPGQGLVSVGSKSFAVDQARIWPFVKAAGYDAAAFRAAGCSWADVKTAGFTAAEARAAGCDVKSAQAAGYNLPSLKTGGYDAAAFRASGCSWADVKTAGFTAAEARAAGCDLKSAQAAGYDPNSLLVAFGYDAVAAGADLSSCMLVSVALCARKLRLTPSPTLSLSPPPPPLSPSLLPHPTHSTSARRPQLVHDAASSQGR
jgi:intracellular multiplication protein IcmE